MAKMYTEEDMMDIATDMVAEILAELIKTEKINEIEAFGIMLKCAEVFEKRITAMK